MIEPDQQQFPDDIRAYYERGAEIGRLDKGIGPLELARTEELLTRYLPSPPALVLDIGGGPGRYATWLARKGYQVEREENLMGMSPHVLAVAEKPLS